MDSSDLLVFLIAFILIVGVNAAIILSARRNTAAGLWRKALRRARNPWETENKDLEELSKLVEQLKDQDK